MKAADNQKPVRMKEEVAEVAPAIQKATKGRRDHLANTTNITIIATNRRLRQG